MLSKKEYKFNQLQNQYSNSKLFIKNVSYEATIQEINNLFNQFGKIKYSKICLDKETSKPIGRAVVEFYDEEKAAVALEKLNGTVFHKRNIKIEYAKNVFNEKSKQNNDEEINFNSYEYPNFLPQRNY